MANGSAPLILPAMERTHRITLELLRMGDGLSGRARAESGDVREFSGRLGLMRTIDELLAQADRLPNTTPAPPPVAPARRTNP